MQNSYWKDGMNQIIKHVLNGKRTIQEAKTYMEKNYVGEDRKAFKHMAFETTSSDTTHELKVYHMLRDAIKLGGGKEISFETVFR
jgi:hypothetical protein